jgi:hypothetical protein
MKTRLRRTLMTSAVLLVVIAAITVVAQVNRPYRNGSVWTVAFIRMKPGMETAYLKLSRRPMES